MAEGETLLRILKETAILGLLAPALLLMMGWDWTASYYGRLGLHDVHAFPPPQGLMRLGFGVLIEPLIGFILVYWSLWGLICFQEKRIFEPLPLQGLPVLALAAAGAWLSAVMNLMEGADATKRLFLHVTVLDLILAALGSMLVATLMFVPLRRGVFARLFAGRTVSGTLILLLVLVAGLRVVADAEATDLASARAWSCAPHAAVRLDAPALGLNRTQALLFITHVDDEYYLRNQSLPGNVAEVLVVPDHLASNVTHYWREAAARC